MILKQITDRESIRAFDPRPIPDELLVSLFEAARWAPSSYNEQPWRFLIAKKENPDRFTAMLSCINDRNRVWAANAAVLIICIARLHATERNIPNRHAYYDLGLAVGNLSVQATNVNIFMRQMAGFHPEAAASAYLIPDGFEPVSMIAMGFRGDTGSLPASLQEREKFPRVRKPLSELVFDDVFGKASDLISKNVQEH